MRLAQLVRAFAFITAAVALTATTAMGQVRVGSKNFTEQFIVAEIYAQALEAAGMKVERKINLGGTLIAQKALEEKQIDLYPEYTGTMQMAIGLRYQALASKQIDVVNGYATDGMISALKLKRLKDDKNLWPPYYLVPVVRKDTLDANPKIADVLNQVDALLDETTMAEMNYKVDNDKEEPKDVARAFLK